jgi:hypothetical protein
MVLLVSCPSCRRDLKLKEEMAGKRVKCPGCGGVVAVPLREEQLPQARPDGEEDLPQAQPEPEDEHPEAPVEEERRRKRPKRRKSKDRRAAEPIFTAMGIDFTLVKLLLVAGLMLVGAVGIVLVVIFSPLASFFSSAPDVQTVDLYTAVNGFRDTGVGERVLQSRTVPYTIPGRKKVIVTRPNPDGAFLKVTVRIPNKEIAEYFANVRGPISLMTLTGEHIQLQAGAEKTNAKYVLDANKNGERGYHFGYTPPEQEGRTPNLREHLGPGNTNWTHEGTVNDAGETIVFAGQRGMNVKTQISDQRLDGSEDRSVLGDLTGAKIDKGFGGGLVSGPVSYVLVTWDKGSNGWMLSDDIEQPNDISLSWQIVCFFPRPKDGSKDLTLMVLGKPRSLKLR